MGSNDEGRKLCLVNWEQMCKPTDKGGLRIRNLVNFNDSLVAKWMWRSIVNEQAQWVKVVKNKESLAEDMRFRPKIQDVPGRTRMVLEKCTKDIGKQ